MKIRTYLVQVEDTDKEEVETEAEEGQDRQFSALDVQECLHQRVTEHNLKRYVLHHMPL